MALSLKRGFVQANCEDGPLSNKRRRHTHAGRSRKRCRKTQFLVERNASRDSDSDSELDSQQTLLPSMTCTPVNNSRVSRAVAQYSDTEEDQENKSVHGHEHRHRHRHQSHSSGLPLSVCYTAVPARRCSFLSSDLVPTLGMMSPSRSRDCVPTTDFAARSKCFDYLVGAIDEAWARYCNSTSHDEEVAYGYAASKTMMMNTPRRESLVSEVSDASVSNSWDASDYTATTSPTDYESDMGSKLSPNERSTSRRLSLQQAHCRVSEVPENVKLQKLKDRLIKAKYYLQDYMDSDEVEDCLRFWNKWDLVKYCAVELVEDDNEDRTVEEVIDDLEKGRCGL